MLRPMMPVGVVMNYFEKSLLQIFLAGVQSLVISGLYVVPYICTVRVPRYSGAELAKTSERYCGIGGRLAANVVWMLVALSICGLIAIAFSDAGSRGEGFVELAALIFGLMLLGLFPAGFALTTGIYPAYSWRRMRLEYIYDTGSQVKTAALWHIGVTFLVPLVVALPWSAMAEL